MAAQGNTFGELEEWIIKTIDSCTTIQQITRSRKLIDLYIKKLSDETELNWEIRKHIKEKLICYYKNAKLEIVRN